MDLTLFFGRFHPLLVHLPIGFLLLAGIIEVTERFSFTKGLKIAVPFILLLGTVSGALACFLGFLLASDGDYNPTLINTHQWAGILTTILAGIAYFIRSGRLSIQSLYPFLLLSVMIGLGVTGHVGGSLTHGSDYLTEYLPFKKQSKDAILSPGLTKIEEAQLFRDLVHPIIKDKCQGCHNKSKQKGQLSFSSIAAYQKGGKHGNTIIPGDSINSELLIRVHLDPSDEKFMPTDGKAPLSPEELQLITYWIAFAKADFDTLFVETNPSPEIIKIAKTRLGLKSNDPSPIANVPPINLELWNQLESKGYKIRELGAGSNLLDVSYSKNGEESNLKELVSTLLPIKENILWLSLTDCNLSNNDLDHLGKFENLQRLKLSNNEINDQNIAALQSMQNLESLNLYATNITAKSFELLSSLPKLKKVYTWRTNINPDEIPQLQAKYPSIEIISGI